MYIVMGATGHVGAATAAALLKAGRQVTIVTRDRARGEPWIKLGAKVAVADIHDVNTLRRAFQDGTRAFLLNPPASPNTDTDRIERDTVRKIHQALDDSGLEKVVAQSTYGAQPGERLGDLNTLYDLEMGLKSRTIPFVVLRAAYYFSNWDAYVAPVRESGVLSTMFPAHLKLPMVSAQDLGRYAAQLLMENSPSNKMVHVEGPDRYSPSDVAQVFSRVLKRRVVVATTPRSEWKAAYKQLGFSDAAAASYARMTGITADSAYEVPTNPLRGVVPLQEHVEALATFSAS